MQQSLTFKEKWNNNYFKVKIVFHFLYFSLLLVIIFGVYNYSLSKFFSLRFLLSDVFEFSLVTLLIYLYYYRVFSTKPFVITKLKWAVAILLCYIFVASYKSTIFFGLYNYSQIYNVNIDYNNLNQQNIYTQIFNNILIYIGLSAILLFLLWITDNIQIIINSTFFETRKALKEAETKLLRRQFNPHFLFNAFNSLYSMSLSNNSNTSDTILKLSNIMRYLTDNSMVSAVKLEKELKFIEEYIAIERIRFGEDANINFSIKGDISNMQIEPLLLITLVENAFKHGFYTNNSASFVHIKALVENKNLLFTVENSIQQKKHFNQTERNGTGIANLKQRLKLSYPKRSKLTLFEKNNVFLAKIWIENLD